MTWALVPRGGAAANDLAAYRFTPLSLETATEREPAWSPDGRSIAYTASIEGVQQLMVREVGASSGVQLTRGDSHVRSPNVGVRRVAHLLPARPQPGTLVGERGGRRTGAGD